MPLAVCATPIGNLADVTLRVLDQLAAADLVLCEDTRRTRVLLERHGVAGASVQLPPSTTRRARTVEVLPRLRCGGDASSLVARRRPARASTIQALRLIACGARRRPPGDGAARARRPSRRRSSRAASALERYQFLGYLPRAGPASSRRCGTSSPPWRTPAVAFESPQRLSAIARVAGGSATGAPCRRLPRAHEGVRGGRPGHGASRCRAFRARTQGRDHARSRPGTGAHRPGSGLGSRRWPGFVASGMSRGRAADSRRASDGPSA